MTTQIVKNNIIYCSITFAQSKTTCSFLWGAIPTSQMGFYSAQSKGVNLVPKMHRCSIIQKNKNCSVNGAFIYQKVYLPYNKRKTIFAGKLYTLYSNYNHSIKWSVDPTVFFNRTYVSNIYSEKVGVRSSGSGDFFNFENLDFSLKSNYSLRSVSQRIHKIESKIIKQFLSQLKDWDTQNIPIKLTMLDLLDRSKKAPQRDIENKTDPSTGVLLKIDTIRNTILLYRSTKSRSKRSYLPYSTSLSIKTDHSKGNSMVSHSREGELTRSFSEYKKEMYESRKVRALYGYLGRKHLYQSIEKAKRLQGNTGKSLRAENLYIILETRLDVILQRSHFFPTIQAARQSILHKRVKINSVIMTYPSYQLQAGDVIKVLDSSILTPAPRSRVPQERNLHFSQSKIKNVPRIKTSSISRWQYATSAYVLILLLFFQFEILRNILTVQSMQAKLQTQKRTRAIIYKNKFKFVQNYFQDRYNRLRESHTSVRSDTDTSEKQINDKLNDILDSLDFPIMHKRDENYDKSGWRSIRPIDKFEGLEFFFYRWFTLCTSYKTSFSIFKEAIEFQSSEDLYEKPNNSRVQFLKAQFKNWLSEAERILSDLNLVYKYKIKSIPTLLKTGLNTFFYFVTLRCILTHFFGKLPKMYNSDQSTFKPSKLDSNVSILHSLKSQNSETAFGLRSKMCKTQSTPLQKWSKPLHLEVSYQNSCAIFLYLPQRIYSPIVLDLDLLIRALQ